MNSWSTDTIPEAGNQMGQSHTLRAARLKTSTSISASQNDGME